MLLEYSYDKANDILEMFKQSELASLTISKGEKDESGVSTFVMEYTLIKDYPEPKQNMIKAVLTDSLPERLQLSSILNQFIENQILDNVNDFSLKFNAVNVRKCEINYSSSYKQQVENVSLINQLLNCIERYNTIITKMGIADQTSKNIYRKEGGNRQKKYTLLTMKDIGDTLRDSLREE